MHIPFTPSELAALRLAARLLDYPTIEMFVRDAALNAANEVFDTDAPSVPIEQPVRGKDILTINGA